MSNLSMIMDALMADIPPNVMSDRGDEIWDAHHRLKLALLEKLSGHPDAQAMIERYREEPDVYGPVLEEALLDTGTHEDPAVTEVAGELLSLVAPLDEETAGDDLLNVPGTYGTGDADTDHV